MNFLKTNILVLCVSLTLVNANANEKIHPINDVETIRSSTGDTLIEADSLYPNPCYDVTSKTAVVNSFDDTITLKQKSERTEIAYCNQVVTPITFEYNLGEVPAGNYKVIDSFDNSVIDKIAIRSPDKTTVNTKVK